MATPLVVSEVAKSFTMHLRDGIRRPVVANVSFSVKAGECVVLGGPSGVGKSSILKMLYGNYGVDEGQILMDHDGKLVNLATAEPRTVLEVRRTTLGYVSQFLRVVPRVSSLVIAGAIRPVGLAPRWCPSTAGFALRAARSVVDRLPSARFLVIGDGARRSVQVMRVEWDKRQAEARANLQRCQQKTPKLD